MFCPAINSECVGESCRDWDKESRQCKVITRDEVLNRAVLEMSSYRKAFESLMEEYKYNTLVSKLAIASLMRDPALDENTKQLIQEALKQPSAELAEKLLKDAGLID